MSMVTVSNDFTTLVIPCTLPNMGIINKYIMHIPKVMEIKDPMGNNSIRKNISGVKVMLSIIPGTNFEMYGVKS